MEAHPQPNDYCKFRIRFGGQTLNELITRLEQAGIMLNSFAHTLIGSRYFVLTETEDIAVIVELSLNDMGLLSGATLPQISNRAAQLGLLPCTLEMAIYIRLFYQSQSPNTDRYGKIRNQSPPGALTVFNDRLMPDAEFPRGFYLRNIDGVLWLRGYRCDNEHKWQPHDRFLFRMV